MRVKKVENSVKTCIICDRDIADSPKRMIPIEQPYINLWIHRDCQLNFDGDFSNYLQEYIKTHILSKEMV